MLNIQSVNSIAQNVIAKISGTPIASISAVSGSGRFVVPSYPFILEWTTTSDNTTITLPLKNDPSYRYSFKIYWGDNTDSVVTSFDDSHSHTYVNAGVYVSTIVGTIEGWSFQSSISAQYLTKIIQWGNNTFKYLAQGFRGCTNLAQIVDQSPFYFSGTSLAYLFCTTYVRDLPANLLSYSSNVTDIHDAFSNIGITSIPQGFLRTTLGITNYSEAFSLCSYLKLNKFIFYNEGEQSTHWTLAPVPSINFSNMFARDYIGASANSGEAPDLWNCNFNGATINSTTCFGGTGNNSTTLTNYASIPSDWK